MDEDTTEGQVHAQGQDTGQSSLNLLEIGFHHLVEQNSIQAAIRCISASTMIGHQAAAGSECLAPALPGSATNIGGYAFGNCTNLASAVISNGFTRVGGAMFESCARLTDISRKIIQRLALAGL